MANDSEETTVIRDTDVPLLPRFFLMVALQENMANLQENAVREDLKDFWDRLIKILEEIYKVVSKIKPDSELDNRVRDAKDVVDTRLVPYLQLLPNVPGLLDSYLPKAGHPGDPAGQMWDAFLKEKPEDERKLAMAESANLEFHTRLPEIVRLYMDQFFLDVIEFRRSIAVLDLPTPYIETYTNPYLWSDSTISGRIEVDKRYCKVKVYYATDRKLDHDGKYKFDGRELRSRLHAGKSTRASLPDEDVLPTLQPLEYGFVEVSIPSIHELGEMESPRFWKKEEPHKHVMILPKLGRKLGTDEGEFFTFLNKDIKDIKGRKTEGDLLIFIHGYNNTHDDTLKRAAQLKFDMRFEGAMVAYSWSSAGSQYSYDLDEVAIKSTVQSLKDFLLAIMVKMKEGTRIHLLAHSMGNRAMIKALDLLHDGHQIPNLPNPRCPISTVTSAAADESPIKWRKLVAKMKEAYPPNAKGESSIPLLSVYSSNRDWALGVSTGLNAVIRLGVTDRLFKRDGGAAVLTLNDQDVIDTTGGRFWRGHSYFRDRSDVIEDIHKLITERIRAKERPMLFHVRKSDLNFFAFNESVWSGLITKWPNTFIEIVNS